MKTKDRRTKLRVTVNGKIHHPSWYYIDKYDTSYTELNNARRHYGLPFVKSDGNYYYNEQDYNDFHAGKIGRPARKYNRKET